jgi:hypothetical protein
MDNPFRKRASENVLDSEAFLQLVSAGPIQFILESHVHGELFDRLVVLLGTPGSGKTTLGRLFEYRNLQTLHDHQDHGSYKEVASVMKDFGAIAESGPYVLAARLVMDSEYRSIWELPYDPALKQRLFLNLIQSRCVLMWLNTLRDEGYKDSNIKFITSNTSPAAVQNIGTDSVLNLRKVATNVEDSVYRVVHALVPIVQERIPELLEVSYDPLSIISFIEVSKDELVKNLKPMIVIDDAHELHSKQFTALTEWLIRRDLQVARWLATRFDIATSANKWILKQESAEHTPGRQISRDYLVLYTNQSSTRTKKRSFKAAAGNIAERYLDLMPIFSRAGLTKLSSMLDENSPRLTTSALTRLKKQVADEIEELRITDERVQSITALIDNYSTAQNETEEVRVAMLKILAHRYSKRTPQQELFTEVVDAEPKRELVADIGILDAARIFLLHDYDRPFYYGFDSLVDAGGGNIEQFLRSADRVVSELESRIIRKRPHILDAATQHMLIKQVAEKTIQGWNFPMSDKVKTLIEHIGQLATDASLTPNAHLDHGANAYGVLQSEFDKIEDTFQDLAQVLHFAVAYNAITIVTDYSCKNQLWTLLELGGYPIINAGLTFKRGGFVEGKMSTLNEKVMGARI